MKPSGELGRSLESNGRSSDTAPATSAAPHQIGLANASMEPVPEISNLSIVYRSHAAEVKAVTGVNLALGANEVLATPEAVLAEPMSVAVRALRKAGGLLGGSVVVIGCGTIGLLVTAAARAAGASSVIAVDPLGPRRAVAASFGGHPVAPNDAREATLDLTGGRGADVVVECSGSKGATARALALLRNGGLCVLVGFHGGSEEFTLLDVILPEKTLVGSAAHMWDDDVAPAVHLLAEGKGSFERIVTHRVPLTDVVRGFELLASRDTAALKIAIEVAPGPRTSRR